MIDEVFCIVSLPSQQRSRDDPRRRDGSVFVNFSWMESYIYICKRGNFIKPPRKILHQKKKTVFYECRQMYHRCTDVFRCFKRSSWETKAGEHFNWRLFTPTLFLSIFSCLAVVGSLKRSHFDLHIQDSTTIEDQINENNESIYMQCKKMYIYAYYAYKHLFDLFQPTHLHFFELPLLTFTPFLAFLLILYKQC